MPRFLGRDYYSDEALVRRELSARASLIVPRRFQEDDEDDLAVSWSGVYTKYKEHLYDVLRPYDQTDDDTGFHWAVSDERVSRVEHLQCASQWKEFDGNFIEIVPSSNPESESSIFDSQPDSVSEVCVAEQFTPLPLQWISKGKGYLEEPMHVSKSEVLTTSLPNLMKWSTAELGPPLQDLFHTELQDPENVSEDGLFGKRDLHLEMSSELVSERSQEPDSAEIFSKAEEFELHHFTPKKAEELLCPVTHYDLPSSSQELSQDTHSLVHEARAACTEQEDLQASPPVPPSVHLEEEESILKELVKIHPDRDRGVEKLHMSPLTVECQPDFLPLNEHCLDKDEDFFNPGAANLESPLHALISSPSHFEDGMDHVFLQSWSPDTLNRHSPLLNATGATALEVKLRYGEACFANIHTVKFLEPQLHNHEQQCEDKPNPVAPAVRLASSMGDWKRSIGQVELNLTWDIASSNTHQFSPCESLIISRTQLAPTWKLSVDSEAIENMVARDLEKKTPKDKESECAVEPPSADQTDSLRDIRSHRESSTNNRLGISKSEDDMKSESFTAGLNSKTVRPELKPQARATKGDAYISSSPLESFKYSSFGETKSDSSAKVQTASAACLTNRQFESAPKEVSHTPAASSQSIDFPFSKTSSGKNLDILETPSGLPGKIPGGKERTKNPSPLQSNSTNCSGNMPAQGASDPLRDASPELDNNAGQTTFDLQFDEDDFDLGSDFFDDINPPDGRKPESDAKTVTLRVGLAVDPVDCFFMMRHVRTTTARTQTKLKDHSIVKPLEVPKKAYPGVITPMTVLPRSVGDAEQRFLTVCLSGPYLTAVEEICSLAEPHVDRLRTQGVVSADAKFLTLQPDYTRFLLKDSMSRLSSNGSQDDIKDGVYKDVAMVHTLRLAVHLVMHCCLESAIVHLATMQDKHAVLTGGVEGLRKTLFQCQFTAQQSRQLHPKVAAVCREMQQHKQQQPPRHKMVVLVAREQPTLLKTLQSVINLDGTATKIWTAQDGCQIWPTDCDCVLTWDQQFALSTLVPLCTLMLEYEADPQSSLHQACQEANVRYVGLSVQKTQMAVAEKRVTSTDTGVTVVGSQHLIQHQQLLQLLETRHNIIVVRRDYTSLGRVHYPDVVVDLHKGAVLVHVRELREEGGLERVTERLAAVGLQLSTIWILLHGIGDTNRNVFDKDALKKMVQLQALMANLSRSAQGFTASYKVLLCRSAVDAALYLSHLTTLASTQSAEADHGRAEEQTPLPPVDMSKEERFLLRIPCLNPFSCTLLLSRATVGEILTMSVDQLRSLAPHLPTSCVQNLHRVVNLDRGLQLRPQRSDTYDSSQTNASSASEQLHNLPESSSTPYQRQNGEVADCAVLSGNQICPPSIDQCLGRADVSTYLRQNIERSDYASPEGIVPLSLSKSLHYSDQPTPFLLPSQGTVGKKRDAFQGRSSGRNDSYTGGEAALHSRKETHDLGFDEVQSVSEQGFQHRDNTGCFQEKLRSQTDHMRDSVCGSQEYTRADYMGDRSSLGYGYPVPPLPLFPRGRQQLPFCTNFSNQSGERKLFPYFGPESDHPRVGEAPHSGDINSSLSNTLQLTSSKSANSFKTLNASAQTSQQNRLSNEQRQFVVSSSKSVERLAESNDSLALAETGDQFMPPYSNLMKMNMHDSFHGGSDLASGRCLNNNPSYAGTLTAMSGAHPGELHRTNSQHSDNISWSNGHFIKENKMFERTVEVNCNENYHPRSETLPLISRFSPSVPTDVYDTWKTPHDFAISGHHVVQGPILATQDSHTAKYAPGPSRSQTIRPEGSACHKDSHDVLESGDILTPFRRLTPDFCTSTSGNIYDCSPVEPSAARHGDEDPGQPSAAAAPPRFRPSFCENLAATTRRLLQGKSPGRLFGAGLHYKSRGTPLHRISVGLAQPLRRQDASSQDSGKLKEQVSQSSSPKVWSQRSLSPPLDMDWESSAKEKNYHITDAKLRKWSVQLQYPKKLEHGSLPCTIMGEEEVCPSAEKRRAVEGSRKLTYQPVPGTGGQTKLTFL